MSSNREWRLADKWVLTLHMWYDYDPFTMPNVWLPKSVLMNTCEWYTSYKISQNIPATARALEVRARKENKIGGLGKVSTIPTELYQNRTCWDVSILKLDCNNSMHYLCACKLCILTSIARAAASVRLNGQKAERVALSPLLCLSLCEPSSLSKT